LSFAARARLPETSVKSSTIGSPEPPARVVAASIAERPPRRSPPSAVCAASAASAYWTGGSVGNDAMSCLAREARAQREVDERRVGGEGLVAAAARLRRIVGVERGLGGVVGVGACAPVGVS